MKRKVCMACGKKFICKNQGVYDKRKTCSKKCRHDLHTIKCKCLQCKKKFEIPKAKNFVGKFCSVKCRTDYQREDHSQILLKKFQNGESIARRYIYRILIKTKGNKCSVCGLTKWQEKPIRLWVDHIDGDPSNSAATNFRLICPNCESQTETSRGKNYGKGRKSKGLPCYS